MPAHPHAPKPDPVEIVEAHISAIEVPVTYTAVLSMIPPLHASKQYDVILHVGVGLPGGLEIERLAHKTGYNQTDADGKLCEGTKGKRGFGQGYEEFGDQIRTGVDVDGVVELLRSKGLKVGVVCCDNICALIYGGPFGFRIPNRRTTPGVTSATLFITVRLRVHRRMGDASRFCSCTFLQQGIHTRSRT